MNNRFLLTCAMSFFVTACQSSSVNPLKFDTATTKRPENSSSASSRDAKDTSAGLAKSASKNASDRIESYKIPQTGTVYTWKNNWANLPEVISYRVAGTLKRGDVEYVKFTSKEGFKNTTHAFYNTSDFSLKGYRDKDDKALVTFKPSEQRYKFPMGPGTQWVTSWKQLDHKSGRVTSGGGVVKAIKWETLKLPIGEVKALKVKMPAQKGLPKGISHFVWFSPEHGITVKEEIGGGAFNWSQILSKVEKPGSS